MAFRKRNEYPRDTLRQQIPDGLWMKCPECGRVIHRSEMGQNLQVCPECGYHFRLGAWKRIEYTVDPGTFEETHIGIEALDPIDFRVGAETYAARLRRAQEKTGLREAIVTGFAQVEGVRTTLGVMDAQFIGASMGSAVGEKFCRLAEDAIREGLPLLVFAASGGARMQEGILALMQMAKTADAVRRIREARFPYISVLTDPTSGGVFASFASLGDVVLAEPGAYIGFAGTRLIEGALKVKLPEGFQRAEYQFENGFLDQVVKRSELRGLLARLLRYLTGEPDRIPAARHSDEDTVEE